MRNTALVKLMARLFSSIIAVRIFYTLITLKSHCYNTNYFPSLSFFVRIQSLLQIQKIFLKNVHLNRRKSETET